MLFFSGKMFKKFTNSIATFSEDEELSNEWETLLENKKNETKSFNPTEDQKKAMVLIRSFLDRYEYTPYGSSNNVFMLKGYAGTGKTTLVNHLIYADYLKGKKIAVTAFTNKATNVISKKTPFAYGISLFKLLGLKTNEESEKLVFDPSGRSHVHEFNIVVLDEVSMVHDDHLELLLQEVKYYSYVKLLIMGDRAQLPPVDQESDSKAFELPNSYELTEIVRQAKNSGIPKYSFYIRNILDDITKKQEKQKRNEKVIKLHDNMFEEIDYSVVEEDYCPTPIKTKLPHDAECHDVILLDDSKKFIDMMLEDFQSIEYKQNADHVKVIAYRNITIDKINAIIRKNIFGEDVQPLVIGENLMLSAPVIDDETGCNIFDTSDEIEVIEILDSAPYREVYKNSFEIMFPYYKIKAKRKYDNKITIMNIVNPLHKGKFNEVMKYWGQFIAKNPNSKMEFKMKYYPFKKQFHNPSYNYAISSHRSQGSTYSCVYVVEDDIEQVSQATTKSLWQSKYVAFTRASEKLVILNRIKNRPELKI